MYFEERGGIRGGKKRSTPLVDRGEKGWGGGTGSQLAREKVLGQSSRPLEDATRGFSGTEEGNQNREK